MSNFAFTFDATTVSPDTGEGGGFIPVSNDPRGTLVTIIKAGTDEGLYVTNAKATGAYMPLALKVMEGPDAGKEGVMRLNLQHEKPDVAMRAHSELSAILHCTGKMRIGADIREIYNAPFRVVSELQDPTKPEGYTQLARGGIRDINGNKAGANKSGPQTAQPAAAAAATGAGWGATPQPAAAVQPQPAPVEGPKFDPNTGQPLQPVQPAAAPAPRFDPNTGQPIQPAAAEQPAGAGWGAGAAAAATPSWGQ